MSQEMTLWHASFTQEDVHVTQTTPAYQGHYQIYQYQLKHKCFNGDWSPILEREHLVRDDATGVLLYDIEQDKVVLIEQFRVGPLTHKSSPWLLEIPAGLNEGERPEEVAIKEVLEETGLTIHRPTLIGEFYTTPGAFSEKITLYYAPVDSSAAKGVHGLAHEGEDIKVIVLGFDEVQELMNSNWVTSASTIIALQWLTLHRTRLRQNVTCLEKNDISV